MSENLEDKSLERQEALAEVLFTTGAAVGGTALVAHGNPGGVVLLAGAPVVGKVGRYVASQLNEAADYVATAWAKATRDQIRDEGLEVTEKLQDLFRSAVPNVMAAECSATRDLMRHVMVNAARLQEDDLALIAAAEAQGLVAAMKPSAATVFALICAEDFVSNGGSDMAFLIGPESKLAKLNLVVLRGGFEGLEHIVSLHEPDTGLTFGMSHKGKWLREWVRAGQPTPSAPPTPESSH